MPCLANPVFMTCLNPSHAESCPQIFPNGPGRAKVSDGVPLRWATSVTNGYSDRTPTPICGYKRFATDVHCHFLPLSTTLCLANLKFDSQWILPQHPPTLPLWTPAISFLSLGRILLRPLWQPGYQIPPLWQPMISMLIHEQVLCLRNPPLFDFP